MLNTVTVPEKTMTIGLKKILVPEFEITPVFIRQTISEQIDYNPEETYQHSERPVEDRPVLFYSTEPLYSMIRSINKSQKQQGEEVEWVLPTESQLRSFAEDCASDNLEDDLEYFQILSDVFVSDGRVVEFMPRDGSAITSELLHESGWPDQYQPLALGMRNNMNGRYFRRIPICIGTGWDVYGFRLVKKYSHTVKYEDVCNYLGIV
jgi:hypothetical protein